MTKYDPLRSYLEGQQEGRIRLSFSDIERLLGFKLPRSARDYRPWWSNNTGGNVAIRSWRDAGWRTAEVDMAGEKVTFVRDSSGPNAPRADLRDQRLPAASLREEPRPFDHDVIQLKLSDLSGSALRLVDDLAEEIGSPRSTAIALLLDQAAIERRRRLMESISARSQPWAENSAELIRKDRDRDEA
jgi:hypothetical protein